MSLSTFSGHLAQHRRDPRRRDGALARAARRAGGGHRSGRGLGARAGARSRGSREQARLTVVTTHYAELKEWASATDGAANAATAYDVETDTPLYRVTLGRPGTSHALRDRRAARARRGRRRGRPRARRAGAAARRGAARRGRGGGAARGRARARPSGARRGASARRAPGTREAELEAEIERVRASRDAERAEAARQQRSASSREARAELEALREEIRAARRHERDRGARSPQPAAERGATAASARPPSGRGAPSGRSRALDEPLPLLAPLAVGDPVEAPRRSACAARSWRSRATRPRWSAPAASACGIPLARLRPSARRASAAAPSRP